MGRQSLLLLLLAASGLVGAQELPSPARAAQRPQPAAAGGFGSFLSGLLGSVTQVADTEACPGKCVHSLASLICDEVLEEVECPGTSMKCCVERGGGMPPLPANERLPPANERTPPSGAQPESKEAKEAMKKEEERQSEDVSAEETTPAGGEEKKEKKRRKKKKNPPETTTATAAEAQTTTSAAVSSSTTDSTTTAAAESSTTAASSTAKDEASTTTARKKDDDEYDDPDYEYTSPGNITSDSSRFHPTHLIMFTLSLLLLT